MATNWQQTPEGRARISAAMKLAHKKKKAAGKAWKSHNSLKGVLWTQTPAGRRHMKKIQRLSRIARRKKLDTAVSNGSNLSVRIEGPDAMKALNELVSNSEYERLDVSFRIEKK